MTGKLKKAYINCGQTCSSSCSCKSSCKSCSSTLTVPTKRRCIRDSGQKFSDLNLYSRFMVESVQLTSQSAILCNSTRSHFCFLGGQPPQPPPPFGIRINYYPGKEPYFSSSTMNVCPLDQRVFQQGDHQTLSFLHVPSSDSTVCPQRYIQYFGKKVKGDNL